jgi:hypothetical protein
MATTDVDGRWVPLDDDPGARVDVTDAERAILRARRLRCMAIREGGERCTRLATDVCHRDNLAGEGRGGRKYAGCRTCNWEDRLESLDAPTVLLAREVAERDTFAFNACAKAMSVNANRVAVAKSLSILPKQVKIAAVSLKALLKALGG